MRKKASTTLFSELPFLIISGIVIVLVLFVGTKLYKIFAGGADEQSEHSFILLARSAEALNAIEIDGECYIEAFSLSSSFSIVGFNGGKSGAGGTCGIFKNSVEKPYDKCGTRPCICICRSGATHVDSSDCIKAECTLLDSGISLHYNDGNAENDLVLETCNIGFDVASMIVGKKGTQIYVKKPETISGIKLCTSLIAEAEEKKQTRG